MKILKNKRMWTLAVLGVVLMASPAENFGEVKEAYASEENSSIITGSCGENVTFTFDETYGVLTIRGTGAIADGAGEGTQWGSSRVYPSKVIIEEGVTGIGDYAFQGFSALKEIVIPKSVKRIGKNAFSNSRLKSLILPEGLEEIGDYAFERCLSLESVTLPTSVKTIGRAAFVGCYTLEGTLVIPKGVTEIAEYAFSGCDGLTGITFPDSLTKIGNSAFKGCDGLTSIVIPASVTSIGEGAFQYCSSLTSAVVPETTILSAGAFDETGVDISGGTAGSNVFWRQENETLVIWGKGMIEESKWDSEVLKSVIIQEGITGIGRSVFAYAEGVTSVKLPSTLKTIGDYAFGDSGRGCAFTEISIPKGVTEIGEYAFYGCKKLTSITIPEGVKKIGKGALATRGELREVVIPASAVSIGNFLLLDTAVEKITIPSFNEKDILYGCKLKELTIKSGTIAEKAFEGNTNLEKVYLGSGVKTIGNGAFSRCRNLKSLTIENGSLTAIGDNAFSRCSLNKLTIPSCVKTIGSRAFENAGVSSVTFSEGLQTIGAYAFADCTELKEATIPKSVTKIGVDAFGRYGTYFSDESGKGTDYQTIPDGFVIKGYSGSEAERYAKDTKNVTFKSIGGVKQPQKGASLTSGKNVYKVTKAGSEVTFQKTTATAQSLTIPATVKIDGTTYKVTSIAANALKGKTKLASVTIGKNVKSIGANAFSGCSKLKILKLGASVQTIASKAFYKCTALTKVTIPSKVTSIGASAFQGCTKLTTLVIGQNVKTIGKNAFSGCSKLKTLKLGASVQTIASKAFYKCTALTKVTIPSKVTSIGASAFQGCTKLTTLVIGQNVKTIGKNAFGGDKKLKTITIKTTKLTAKTVGASAFKGIVSKVTIKVPSAKKEAYQTLLKKKGVSEKAVFK